MTPEALWRTKHVVAEKYLSVLGLYARRVIRDRAAARDFTRVAIVAPAQRRNGIASGAHLQVAAFRRAGMQAELLDANATLRNPFARVQHRAATAYVYQSGGPQLSAMVAATLPHAATGWRVAYWAWELPEPPRQWPDPTGLVSEIWTPSDFARCSLSKRFTLPIHVVPHVVLPSPPEKAARCRPFTVLTFADTRSSFERKNPAGAIRAFIRAFGTSATAKLIVKLNGSPAGLGALPREALGHPNIEFVSAFLDPDGLASLYRSVDALLSLHRAEGFGLPMLEAMAMGIPVVATAWSGNLDFMDKTDSVLVPFTEVPVRDKTVYGGYEDAVWAEPDEACAVTALRRLHDDLAYRAEISQAALSSAMRFCQAWSIPAPAGR